MAISLTISDGTTTVTLSGTSPVLGCTYFPATPNRNNGEWQDVTETVEVNLRSTAATMRATVNSIEALFESARRRQDTGMGVRVYANYAPVSETTFRSEILDGRVVWSTDPGLRRLDDANPTIRVAVIWTRRYYWEGAEAELSISANGQAAATGGRAVTNDPANGNWIQVAAALVTGNLPAPIRLQMQNIIGSAEVYHRIYLAVNAYSDPANLVHFLQAEAASGVTPVDDGNASGGHHIVVNASAAPTLKWTLPAADLQRLKGRPVRILARIDSTSTVYVTPQVRDAAGTGILWTGDEISIGVGGSGGVSWDDCGVVPMPPGGYGAVYAALTLALVFRGAETVAELDVLQLTTLDSYRSIELAAASIADDESIVHDGIEEISYILSGSTWLPLAASFGQALLLQPNTLQRIYILHDTVSNADAPIANTFSVRAYYRPRRVTV
jgi:hypothetical protein